MTAATATEPALRAVPRSRTNAPAALTVTGLAIAGVFALPIVYLVAHGLGLGADLVRVLRDEHAGQPLLRTLVLAGAVSVGASVVGTALAWLCTRTDLPGRRAWRVVVPLPLVVPSFVGALALVAAFAPGGIVDEVLSPVGLDRLPRVEGFWAATLVLTLLTYPYVYLPVSARLSGLPPSLEESARALGRAPWAVFRTVVWPQLSGAVAAGALLVFLYCLSEFGAVQLLHYDTLTRAIFAARLYDRDVAMALSLLLVCVALVVVAAERVVARRRIDTEAVSATASSLQAPLGAWKLPALGFVTLVVGLALFAPALVLAHWTIRGALGEATLHTERLGEAAITTVLLALAAAVVTVAAVLPVAYLTVRHRSASGEAANAVIVSGFALPGLVVALTLVYFVLQSPFSGAFYQTFALLVFAYAVHFGAQGLRSSQVAVSGVPLRLSDAARSLGARRWERLRTIELPLMRRGLAAGAGLVLLSTMKELPATLVLAPPGATTLSTWIWSSTEDGFYAEAGFAALVLLAVSGVLTWFLTVRSADRSR